MCRLSRPNVKIEYGIRFSMHAEGLGEYSSVAIANMSLLNFNKMKFNIWIALLVWIRSGIFYAKGQRHFGLEIS